MNKFLWDMYRLYKFARYCEYDLNRHQAKVNKKNKELEKKKKQNEELKRKQETNKRFKEITKPNLDEQKRIINDVWKLKRTVDEIRFPTICKNKTINIKDYVNDNGQYNVDKLYVLRSEVRSLKNRSEKCNFEKECIVENLELNFLYQTINDMINEHKNDVFTKPKIKENESTVKEDSEKETRINNSVSIEITPLYRKFVNEIVGRKFSENDKMKMVKRIGNSGLNVEQRKTLISLIKTK